MKLFFSFIVFLVFLSSCASRNELVYLQQDSIALKTNQEPIYSKLQPGDVLAISVTSDDVRATIPFNQMSNYNVTGNLQANNPFIPTYIIDNFDQIDFPKIGKITIGGMTRAQAIEKLKSEVSKYIVNPGISMEHRNFRVTVLGEVKTPGNFPITTDRITILEALGLAGDLTINGVRKNVLVIREENGVKKEFRIDLTKREALNSPVFYLAQNDVIYVEPNGAKIQSSKYTQNTSIFVSIASVIITVISVLTR